MKKILLIAVSLMFILSGCSKKEIKEYDINTYFDLANQHKDKVNEKLENLTATEIKEREDKIKKEIANEIEMPYNETILLRGKKAIMLMIVSF